MIHEAGTLVDQTTLFRNYSNFKYAFAVNLTITDFYNTNMHRLLLK